MNPRKPLLILPAASGYVVAELDAVREHFDRPKVADTPALSVAA